MSNTDTSLQGNFNFMCIDSAKLPSDHVAAAARPLGCTMKPKTYVPKTAFLPQARGSVPPTGPNPCIP
ncbi:hypothetical protein FF1_035744 [Malus domestica]|uniref:Uncharacterized protein n=1 Tax=Malus domestica TaxID=3750 RepID=A0A498JWJ1_MALDO|nr:hypothetical protein DVH24_010658 [Malus domestica]